MTSWLQFYCEAKVGRGVVRVAEPSSGSHNAIPPDRFNSDNTLPTFGVVPSRSIVDFGIGLGAENGKYDLHPAGQERARW